ncbi:MAG: hypothetical protein HYU51_12640 [Candidatus Rokubacteria bacterium]|nr:hypothetical protein [Candidatus Rokubacteria bacterium]
MDSGLPCGCRIGRDEGKFRLWYCPTHAVAYEMLEVLRLNLSVLDQLINNNAPSADVDLSTAMDVGMRARKVIRKATTGVWA